MSPLKNIISTCTLGGINVSYNQIADVSLLDEYSYCFEITDWGHQDITMPFFSDSVETPYTLYRFMAYDLKYIDGKPHPIVDHVGNCSSDANIYTQ